MIFLIWSNYDGMEIEKFEEVKDAELRVAEIKAIEDDENAHYGTQIHAVIQGSEYQIETIEVTSKVRLR